ncbi:hypothetical protein CNEO4_830006 [Clostridium neonatale]|nr:hypothetical protein CNEO4_830006 [Clostridium neonatale]
MNFHPFGFLYNINAINTPNITCMVAAINDQYNKFFNDIMKVSLLNISIKLFKPINLGALNPSHLVNEVVKTVTIGFK